MATVPHVLLAEDDADIRTLIELKLDSIGLSVQAVPDGPAALAAVADRAPDLVLLDVRMPGLDGFETARRLRAAHPAAVVVLISTDDVTGPMCDSCGASAFLQKKEFGQAALRRLWAAHGR